MNRPNVNRTMIVLSKGHYLSNGIPVVNIGPFPNGIEAGRWFNEHNPGHWKGHYELIASP